MNIVSKQSESASELLEFLKNSNVPFWFDNTDDGSREFWCFEVYTEKLLAAYGICAYGSGIKPQAAITAGVFFVGFNTRIVAFPIGGVKPIFQLPLGTLFWMFLACPLESQQIVLCETAVLAVTGKGDVLWREDMDLITDFQFKDGLLYLETFGGSKVIDVSKQNESDRKHYNERQDN